MTWGVGTRIKLLDCRKSKKGGVSSEETMLIG
jgi:hypothetical protein